MSVRSYALDVTEMLDVLTSKLGLPSDDSSNLKLSARKIR